MNAPRDAGLRLVVCVLSVLLVPGLLPGCGGGSTDAPTLPRTAVQSPAPPTHESTREPASDEDAVRPAAAAQAPTAPATDSSDRPAADPSASETESTAVPSLWTRRSGQDWPHFLGPTGDSKSAERGIVQPWPAAGPRLVWQRPIGEGYGIGSVSRGRLLQFDRYGHRARLICLNAETGEPLWQFEYPTDYEDLYQYNGGPRASPVIDGERVYIYGVEGLLHCLNVVDGSLVWKLDTRSEFGVIQNFFGVGSTPVIAGDLLLVMVGGSPDEDKAIPLGQLDRVSPNGSAIVGLDKRTGQVRYKSGDELASYASLKLARIGDRWRCLAFCRGGLLSLDPQNGAVDFHFPWRAKILESVNASTPVVAGNRVFISETYSIGSALLDLGEPTPTVVWQDDTRRREKSFKAHWNTPVLVDGYLYGCSGRNPPDAELRCIAWDTGEIQWTEPNQIRTSLLYVDGHFVCLGEYGALQLIKVNPQRLEVVSEVKLRDPQSTDVLPPGLEPRGLLRPPCWAAPILSHGLMYVRGDDRLVCLELIPEPK